MRIAYLPDGRTVNAAYRSIAPMLALSERGHETRELEISDRGSWHDILRWCEVLHIHRVCDGGAIELARAAKAAGAAVVWDDDDDVTRVPKGAAGYKNVGGAKAARRLAARSKLFEVVDLVTTPSAYLAEVFRDGGARDVAVIENYVIDAFIGNRAPKNGLTIGWVAAEEHRLDLTHIPVTEALATVLERNHDVRVTTIGVKLNIANERYRHSPPVNIEQLMHDVSAFDIGIAPLSPALAINHARSNIKLKEYAAAGVPWLASPIGPYAGMGEQQGGVLVADDGWAQALNDLIQRPRRRRKLARRAGRWGSRHTLTANSAAWSIALSRAIALRQ